MPSLQPSSQIRRASSRFSTRSPAASARLRYGRNLLAATLTAALLAACSGSDQGKAGAGAPGGAMGPMPVTALAVQSQRLPAMLEVTAQTEGAREIEVRAQVAGILVKRLFTEGDTVKAGQPLFQIDPATYDNAAAEARAKAEQTERELQRLKGLLPQKAISQKEYDDAVSANAVAQAARKQAELQLARSIVRAPAAGVTGRALKSEGNLIGTANDNSLLTTISQVNPLWVRFSLADGEIAKLPNGKLNPKDISGVELVLPDGSTYAQRGKINFLGSTIDPNLGTLQLRAEFPNAEGKLLPGQFVRARLLLGEREGVFLVPQSAVVQTEQATLLMTVDAEGKVAPRPVQLGEWYGKDWVVLGGLKDGDQVIVDNLMKLRPGMPVAPKAPGAAPAGTPGKPADGKAPEKAEGNAAAKPADAPATAKTEAPADAKPAAQKP